MHSDAQAGNSIDARARITPRSLASLFCASIRTKIGQCSKGYSCPSNLGLVHYRYRAVLFRGPIMKRNVSCHHGMTSSLRPNGLSICGGGDHLQLEHRHECIDSLQHFSSSSSASFLSMPTGTTKKCACAIYSLMELI